MFGHRAFGALHPHARLFEKGDLKYVILELLADKPRHGYEIIRALSERVGPFYTPSAGAVYPTLQLLEDMGAVTAEQRDGKKIYTITEEGRKFLTERKQVVDDIRDRIRRHWDPGFRADMHETMHDLRELGRLLRHSSDGLAPDKLRRIRDVLARARREIEAILTGEGVHHL